ncbi:MAG: hypothetical protein IAI50_18490 [Candidatus Eremiobacteraeota bacterium]|nr:hypothetical protein [Candidatus Eremiobacteraeota bacterium]
MALVSFAPLAASADGVPGLHSVSFRVTQDDDSDKTPAVPAKNAGSIDGQVVSVDYKLSHIAVKAAGTQYDVIVSPSTEFRGHNNNFHTIADIQKGAHVQVMMSQRAGTYTATIIRLF